MLSISMVGLCVDLLLGFDLHHFVQKPSQSDYPMHDDRIIRSIRLSDVRAPDYPTGYCLSYLHTLIQSSLDSINLKLLD